MNYLAEAEYWEQKAKENEKFARAYGLAGLHTLAWNYLSCADAAEQRAQRYRQLAESQTNDHNRR